MAKMSCHHFQSPCLLKAVQKSSASQQYCSAEVVWKVKPVQLHLQRVAQHSCSHDSSRHALLYACMPVLLSMYPVAIATGIKLLLYFVYDRLCLHGLSLKLKASACSAEQKQCAPPTCLIKWRNMRNCAQDCQSISQAEKLANNQHLRLWCPKLQDLDCTMNARFVKSNTVLDWLNVAKH